MKENEGDNIESMDGQALSNDSQSTAETQVNRKPLMRYVNIMTLRRDLQID